MQHYLIYSHVLGSDLLIECFNLAKIEIMGFFIILFYYVKKLISSLIEKHSKSHFIVIVVHGSV